MFIDARCLTEAQRQAVAVPNGTTHQRGTQTPAVIAFDVKGVYVIAAATLRKIKKSFHELFFSHNIKSRLIIQTFGGLVSFTL